MYFARTVKTIAACLALVIGTGCGTDFEYEEGGEYLQENSDELRTRSHQRDGARSSVDVRDVRDVRGEDQAEFELVPCERETLRRGLVCLGGFWTTGDRCSSDRQCTDGSVCLSPREPHCYLVAEEPEPMECPRGSFGPNTPILCAPGFEPELVTRDGCSHCVPVAEECGAAERCRAAGMGIRECIEAYAGSARRAAHIIEQAATMDVSLADVLRIIACGDDDDEAISVRRTPARRRAAASGESERVEEPTR
jgi:hypothetical protein